MRQTHTVATLPISVAAYEEISRLLKAAGYDHCFMHSSDGRGIDMSGIAVVPEPQGEVATVQVLPVMQGEVVVVPILEQGFDHQRCVGSVTLVKDKMPPNVNWVLALGYLVDKMEYLPRVEGAPIGIKVNDYTLSSVALVSDADYKRYLESPVYKADNP